MILAFWVTDLRLELLVSAGADTHQTTAMQIKIPYAVVNNDTIHYTLVINDLLRLSYVGVSMIRFQNSIAKDVHGATIFAKHV